MLDEAAVEPPVPAGLGQLSAPLSTLAQFLRLDDALIETAAARSAKRAAPRVSARVLRQRIGDLPSAEKDAFLLKLAQGDAPHLHAELLQRLESLASAEKPSKPAAAKAVTAHRGRTVAELLAAIDS